MLLFVNQSENMLTTQKAGVLATIHNANETLIPNVMGFSVPVGFAVTFGVRRVSIKRLSAPYGDCVDFADPNEYFYNSSYSVEVCSRNSLNLKKTVKFKGCRRSNTQRSIIDKCACGDPRIPKPSEFKVAYCKADQSNFTFAFSSLLLQTIEFI